MGTYQNAIDVKGCRTPEDSADIRMIHNSLEHADAHGASLGTRIQRGEKGARIGQRWTTKRSERATRHRKTGEITHEVHRPHKRRNIKFGTLLFQALKKRLQLRDPTLAQRKLTGSSPASTARSITLALSAIKMPFSGSRTQRSSRSVNLV